MKKYYVRDILTLILGIILIAFCVAFIVQSFFPNLHEHIALQLGSLILLAGACLLFLGIYYFIKTNLINWTIVIGGATFTSLAICVFINPTFLLDVLSIFLSVFFFVAAVLSFIYSIKGLIKKTRFFTAILGLLFAGFLITIGVLLLIEERISDLSFVLLVIGIIAGIIGLIITTLSILDLNRLNIRKNAINDEAIIDDNSQE